VEKARSSKEMAQSRPTGRIMSIVDTDDAANDADSGERSWLDTPCGAWAGVAPGQCAPGKEPYLPGANDGIGRKKARLEAGLSSCVGAAISACRP
jgi:hypothetical protein